MENTATNNEHGNETMKTVTLKTNTGRSMTFTIGETYYHEDDGYFQVTGAATLDKGSDDPRTGTEILDGVRTVTDHLGTDTYASWCRPEDLGRPATAAIALAAAVQARK